MLQQTSVSTVIPYFERWMERLPSVGELAEASERKVLSLWEGMGYYQRARRLRRAARLVVEEFGGRIPRGRDELRSLPGIGPYISAAVRSFAFGEDEVALDANLLRVCMRLLGLQGRGSEAAVRRRVRNWAEAAMPSGESADWNQALMDFGSLACRPRSPRCGECFLREACKACAEGTQHDIPPPRNRRFKKISTAVALFIRDGRIYIQRRPPNGLFAGMWEFPGGKVEEGESAADALVRECREELGVECAPGEKLLELTHYYTVFEVRLHAFLCPPPAGLSEDETHCWVPIAKLGAWPMPSANRQVVKVLHERAGAQQNGRHGVL